MFHVVCETEPGTFVERFMNDPLLDKDGVEQPRSILSTMVTSELAALGLHRVAHPVAPAELIATGYRFESGEDGAPICVLVTRAPTVAELKSLSGQLRGLAEQHTELVFEKHSYSASWGEIARLQVHLESGQSHRVRDMAGDFVDLNPEQLAKLRARMIHRVNDATAVEAAVNAAISTGEISTMTGVRKAYHEAFVGTFTG